MVEPLETVRRWFLDAGWHPGRAVAVPPSVPAGHPAGEILATFGGLIILERFLEPQPPWRPIEEMLFRELHPSLAVTEFWGVLLGTRLVGVADLHNGYGELYVAADGRCFESSCAHSAFYYWGASFAEAVEAMLLGRQARATLQAGELSVPIDYMRITADNPELSRHW